MVRLQKSKKLAPTDTELALLKILWDIQPATVRQVYERASKTQTLAYTSVLKMLQIMLEKGLVMRDESERAHVYSTKVSQLQTQTSLVQDMLSTVFGNSKFDLVMRALDDTTKPEELAEIRNLLDSLEDKHK